MNYLSVCSGIEAATVAWHPLGWTPVAFSEIEPFPCSLLAHHYPDVPNLGDMTQFDEWPEGLLAKADILVGGTPCQAFSVAGNRNSLNDHRGNLTLIYANLLDRIDAIRIRLQLPPAVCVWENVPGVLSTKDNAFGCFLAELAGEDAPLQPPGKRWTDAGLVRGPKRAVAWRILDAQYFGLAQRRRRVFLVAGAGEGFDPSQVLFEFQGLRRDSAPSREAGEGTSRDASIRTGGSHWDAPGLPHPSLNQSHNTGGIGASNQELFSQRGAGLVPEEGHTLRGKGFDASGTLTKHIGAGGETQSAAFVAHQRTAYGIDEEQNAAEELMGTLKARSAGGGFEGAVACYDYLGTHNQPGDPCHPRANHAEAPVVAGAMAVRRLTPRECERLQGFPDNYSLIPHRGKSAADGPRYKALGNSKAVPVVRWIGRRLGEFIRANQI